MHRTISLIISLALVVAACGGGEETETTEAPAATEASVADPAPTEASTTTAAATTTTEAETTTTTAAPAMATGDLVELALQKVAAIEAAIPGDYTWETVEDEIGDEDTGIYEACLDENDFDLSLLDDITAAAYDTDLDAPAAGIFGSASGSLEVRVFDSSGEAAEAFSTLQKVLGTEEGRDCVGQELLNLMSEDMGDGEVTLVVEEGTVPADVSARFLLTIAAQGIEATLYWDLAASLDGECSVFAVFQAFDEPFDADIAATLMGAGF